MDWSHLSSLEAKREHYSVESYFREAMWDASSVLGERLCPILHRVALVVFKPESLAGRRVEVILDFLSRSAFTPIYCRPFTYTRHVTRELWRYQWNAATIDKMDVATRVNIGRPTLMVLLRDDAEPRELPAAVRMKRLKGAAAPEAREQNTLRSVLDAPNRLITFIHTADEPADVIRELGIFFDRPARRQILAALPEALRGDASDECAAALARLEADAPRADFDPEAAWRRVIDRADGDVGSELEAHRDAFRRSGKIDWEPLLELCQRVGADEWDIVSIGTAAVETDDPDLVRLIDFDEEGIQGWLNGKAAVCTD